MWICAILSRTEVVLWIKYVSGADPGFSFGGGGGAKVYVPACTLRARFFNLIQFSLHLRCCTTQIANGINSCNGIRFCIRWKIVILFNSAFTLCKISYHCTICHSPFVYCCTDPQISFIHICLCQVWYRKWVHVLLFGRNCFLYSFSTVSTVHHRSAARYQSSAPQSITEKPMEYQLDEWFVMTPYVGALLHPAMFSYLITNFSGKGGLKIINCIVQSAQYWCPYGTSGQWQHKFKQE